MTDLGAVPVGPACTIEEALTFIDAREFDAVLLDANLHNRSSEPVAQRLARESIPYVVVTGYNAISWQTAPAKLVAKPYTDLEIADALRAVLHSPVGSV